jgi:hypothetical protein
LADFGTIVILVDVLRFVTRARSAGRAVVVDAMVNMMVTFRLRVQTNAREV